MSAPIIEQFLERSFRALLALLILLGAPFVFWYESEGVPAGGWSSRYIVGVIIPFIGVAAVVLLGSLSAGKRALGSLEALVRGRVGAITATVGVGVGAAYGLRISNEHASILMAILIPCAVVLTWAGVSRDVTPLLPFMIVLLLGIVLFAAETPRFLRNGPMAVWGHREIFHDLFPVKDPFIGRGGRLRPGLDLLMDAPEYVNGAHLVTNSDGFRNSGEFSPEPARSEFRILSLGDSFSNGFCPTRNRSSDRCWKEISMPRAEIARSES